MNNIRSLREQSDFKQIELCKRLGVSQGTLSNWENDNFEPDKAALFKMSEIFGVSIDYILGNSTDASTPKGKFVPVLGTVPAGIPIEAIEEILDYEEVTPDMAASGDLFGLRVRGDSMTPKINDGDVLIVRQQSTADTGDVVVAFVNGDCEATVKKYVRHDNGVSLVPYNGAYEPKFFTPEEVENLPVTIVGVVLESRRKFKQF